jgi:glycosyltransferase involved in cell wall biosynthesis
MLKKHDGNSIFPKVSNLPMHIQKQLGRDLRFKSQMACDYDMSWRAIQLGYIGDAVCYKEIVPVSVYDNYVFIRKYVHWIWVLYVLILRLLSFKNPIVEVLGWWQSRDVNQKNSNLAVIPYLDWDTYESLLLQDRPLVSVVIPTLNRYDYLKDVFRDLEKQTYDHFEVLVVDQTDDFQNSIYEGWNIDLHYWHQKEKALWKARNNAIKKAKGDYILLYDDDSRVDSNWISNHIKCLDYFKADLSSGISISKTGAPIPSNYSFFRISDQLDTGNVLLKKEVFEKIGLFDCQFEKQRMGDGEFGLRSYLSGCLNISNPYAKRLHLKVGTGGLRDMGSWDAFRPKKWFSPRPIPSVLYLYRKYYGNNSARLALIKTIPPSIMPYRYKKSPSLMLLGAILSVFISPIIILQVYRSWQLSDFKLKEGEKIEKLNND